MSKRYCYLDPIFPKKAFIIILFLFEKGQPLSIFSMPRVHDDVESASEELKMGMKENNFTEEDFPPDCILVPLTFHSNVPLKKDYWQEPSIHLEHYQRDSMYFEMMKNPEFYYLLVTPTLIENTQKTWSAATIPLKDPKDTKTIENFMYTSDQVVDNRAKYAAIYKVGEPLGFNWKTKEITKVEKSNYSKSN